MSRLLIDERIVAVQPSVIRVLGRPTDAIVLQQLHFWMGHAVEELDGERWVYKTYDEWSDETGLTNEQVRHAMKRLEKEGVVVACQPEYFNRRKWYRIDYDHKLLSDSTTSSQSAKSPDGSGEMADSKRRNGGFRSGEMAGSSLTQNTQEKTTETRDYDPDFATTWEHYPRKQNKRGAYRGWKARLRDGVSPESLHDAVLHYAESCRRNGTETKYVMHGATFFGPSHRYEDYIDGPIIETTGSNGSGRKTSMDAAKNLIAREAT